MARKLWRCQYQRRSLIFFGKSPRMVHFVWLNFFYLVFYSSFVATSFLWGLESRRECIVRYRIHRSVSTSFAQSIAGFRFNNVS